MQSNVEPRLRLAEFKALYKTLKTNTPWIDHLLLGVLLWLEEKLLSTRVENEIDEAIKEYKTLHETDMPDMVTPTYTETPGDNALGVSEMRLTAPYTKKS